MKKQTKILQFKVIIEQDEDGWFVASAPAIPGCHTQGKTYEEVIKNITEAIELCLEVAKEDKKKPSPTKMAARMETFLGPKESAI